MGLMHDALAQIEVKTPPPVILPLTRVQKPSVVPRPTPIVPPKRFTFPELPEPQEPLPASQSPQVVWPEIRDAETAAACTQMAEGMLRQLPGGRSRVAAFTSPGDGDGKTSLLMALAPQLAKQITGGVLAVDANFHKPSLAARVRMPAGQPANRSLLIYPTNLPRLSFLPALPERPERCLDESWIEELREGWSLVLLDMASLAYAEVAPLAALCDGVYLVVRLGYTPRRAIADASRVIRGAGGRLLGCVAVG
jgi:Mrp family chromosome partitioning ATPase